MGITLFLLGLAIFALIQWRQAVEQRKEAERNLQSAVIATSESYMDKELDVALLLASEAEQMADTPRARVRLQETVHQPHPIFISFLHGHSDNVSSVAFSPDGRILASVSYDKNIRLWDVKTRQSLATLAGHTGEVTSVAFSPDGTTLASASGDQSVRLWDVTTQQPLITLAGHTATVDSVVYSPDSRLLASAGRDKKIFLWDVKTRQLLGTLSGHMGTVPSSVKSIAFNPNGRILASASIDQSIRLLDFEPDSLVRRACKIANRNFRKEEWTKFFGDRPYHKTCPDLLDPQEATKREPTT